MVTRKAKRAPTNREVLALAAKWARVLGLGRRWQIGVRVNRAKETCSDADFADHVAFAEVDDGYFVARIEVNWYAFGPETDLDLVVAHEIAHVALWRLTSIAEAGAGRLREVIAAEIEQAVETVARALVTAQRERRGRR